MAKKTTPKKRGPGRPPGSKNKKKATVKKATVKKATAPAKKERGAGSTDGDEIPIAHRQMLLCGGNWQPKIPAAINRRLKKFDKLDKAASTKRSEATAAKKDLIAHMKDAGIEKVRLGDEYIIAKADTKLERKPVPKNPDDKKK